MRLAKGKKGLELTMGTMVISILVLTVLIVLILIFTGVLGGVFVPGVNNCVEKGGECRPSSDCGFDKDYTRIVGKCETSGEVCCVKTAS